MTPRNQSRLRFSIWLLLLAFLIGLPALLIVATRWPAALIVEEQALVGAWRARRPQDTVPVIKVTFQPNRQGQIQNGLERNRARWRMQDQSLQLEFEAIPGTWSAWNQLSAMVTRRSLKTDKLTLDVETVSDDHLKLTMKGQLVWELKRSRKQSGP